jgi:hypothetical protein
VEMLEAAMEIALNTSYRATTRIAAMRTVLQYTQGLPTAHPVRREDSLRWLQSLTVAAGAPGPPGRSAADHRHRAARAAWGLSRRSFRIPRAPGSHVLRERTPPPPGWARAARQAGAPHAAAASRWCHDDRRRDCLPLPRRAHVGDDAGHGQQSAS